MSPALPSDASMAPLRDSHTCPDPLAPRPGALDVPGGQLVADPARPGLQEQPDPVLLVQADLDEVVAGAERAELQPPVRRDRLGAVRAVALLQLADPPAGLAVV